MNKTLLAAAAAGFALSAQTDAAPKKSKKVECFGVTSQQAGSGACSVKQPQIDAARSHFQGQYTNAVEVECKGNNSCKAGVHLAWVPKKSKADCFEEKGFLIEKKDGKLQIVEK